MNEADEYTLAPEWRTWVAENLFAGKDEGEIKAGLREQGLSDADADAWVCRIAASPVTVAARKVTQRAKRAEMILRLESIRGRSLQIGRHEKLRAEDFHAHYRAANLPVLLPDFTKDWAARNWSFDLLEQCFSDAPIQAMDGRTSDPDYDRNHSQHVGQTTVGEFIGRIRQDPESNDFYVVARDHCLRGSLAALIDDINPPVGYFTAELVSGCALWLGPGGTLTPLHHDRSDILFTQFVGTKRFRLIAPYELAVADAANGLYGPATDSFAEIEALKGVKVHEITLGPGDTLFIPMGWWHEVLALEPSISVAINAFSDNYHPWYLPGGAGSNGDANQTNQNGSG